MKQCSKCKSWLPLSAFSVSMCRGKPRVYPSCKACEAKQSLHTPDVVRLNYARPVLPRSGW